LSNLLPGVEEDTQAAYKENADFMEWAKHLGDTIMNQQVDSMDGQKVITQALGHMPIMVEPIVDDHALHFLTHRRLALTFEFKALPEQVKQLFFQHMMQHKQDLMFSKLIPQAPSPPAPGMSGQAIAKGQQATGT
jgi:hypothetical protein